MTYNVFNGTLNPAQSQSQSQSQSAEQAVDRKCQKYAEAAELFAA